MNFLKWLFKFRPVIQTIEVPKRIDSECVNTDCTCDSCRFTSKEYRLLTPEENEKAIIQIFEILLDKSIPFSGAHRKKQWEKGWAENLESGNNTPKYFGKYPIQRLNGKFVCGLRKGYEQDMLYSIVDDLAKKYLKDQKDVYEFGCGTGHNLWRVKDLNPDAKLHGFDWTISSNKMIEAQGFHAENFDFFKPSKVKLAPNAGVFTVAALEQVGTHFKPFVNYLIKNKPSVVVHIEPIPEMLDSSKLLDYLSIQYMHKRNYLRGYADYLEELEKKGKIKILEKHRSGIGSYLIDGYSVIVWKPL